MILGRGGHLSDGAGVIRPPGLTPVARRGDHVQGQDKGNSSAVARWLNGITAPRGLTFFYEGPTDQNANVAFLNETANSGTVATASTDERLIRQLNIITTNGSRAARGFQRAGAAFSAASSPGTGTLIYVVTNLRWNNNSDATDTYTTYAGFTDAVGGEPVDGICLRHDSNADATAHVITRANNVETDTDTGVTIAAGTFYDLVIIVTNKDSAEFWLGVTGGALALVATHTTNIPDYDINVARQFGCAAWIIRTATGANTRTVDVGPQLVAHDRLKAA